MKKTKRKRSSSWSKCVGDGVELCHYADPSLDHIHAAIVGTEYGWSVGVHVESFRREALTKAGKPRKRSRSEARRIADELMRFAKLRRF